MTFGGFYSKKRVLVTGDSGFKGSWLAFWLSSLESQVLGVSLAVPVSMPNASDVLGLPQRAIDRTAVDVCDRDQVFKVFREYQPEVVFHLAAQPLVSRSYLDPLGTIATNVMGTANVLEAVRQVNSVKVAIMVTSDKVYLNNEWHYPYREIDTLGGHDPYSASKSCADLLIDSYRTTMLSQRKDLVLCTVRSGNVIGGGDWGADRLVPDVVRAISEKGRVYLRHPESVRPWQHVLEPLSGYLWLAARSWENPSYSGSWNFGPNNSEMVSTAEVAHSVMSAWGSREDHFGVQRQHFAESTFLRLDISKAQQELQWMPIWSFTKAIEETVRWYRAFYTGCPGVEMVDLTREQIANYCGDAKAHRIQWAL